MNTTRRLPLFALSLVLCAYSASAQVSISTLGAGGAYNQDFSVLTTGNFPLTDNTSIPGVYAFRALGNTNPNVFIADNGSNAVGGFRNYGPAGDPDRALGGLADAFSTADLAYGIRFQNDTAMTITSIEVRYTGEQWRDASTAAQTLSFSYRTDPGNITDLVSGTYTLVPSLDFTSPTNTGSSGPIDGNDPANREEIVSSFAVSIPPGQEIMLRWVDFSEIVTNQGLAIDDVQVIARAGTTAADATISGRVVAADGRGISGARVYLSGGELAEPVHMLTNAFGYFSFTGVESGETYLVTVSSKRHSFAQPTRVIDLLDSAFDVDFVAEP